MACMRPTRVRDTVEPAVSHSGMRAGLISSEAFMRRQSQSLKRNASLPKESDRRNTCRYPAVIKEAVLGWCEGEARKEITARLENISHKGCLATSKVPIPRKPGETVWLKLPTLESSEWVEGVLRSVAKPFLRRCSVRIEFLTPLPFSTFKSLVYGSIEIENQRDLPEHESDHFWR